MKTVCISSVERVRIFVINKVFPVVCIGSFLKCAKYLALEMVLSSQCVCFVATSAPAPVPSICLTYSAISGDNCQNWMWGRENVSYLSLEFYREGCVCCCQKECFFFCSWKCWHLEIFWAVLREITLLVPFFLPYRNGCYAWDSSSSGGDGLAVSRNAFGPCKT